MTKQEQKDAINIEAVNARAKEEQTPMTKIPSVVEVVEAIRQRHIHLKANNPVGFVHLFADIKKALTAEREAGAREYRQFILNVLDGTDIADIADGECNTKAIRFAIASRIIK